MTKPNGFSLVAKLGVFATLALCAAVLVLSPAVFNVGAEFEGSGWWLLGLGAASALIGGLRYFVFAVRELGKKLPGQFFLGSVGLLVLVGFGVYSSLAGLDDVWWQVSAVASVMSVGDWYLQSLRARISGYSPDLIGLLPEFADVLDGKEIERVRASEVEIGDILFVRPGAVVAADGTVVQGESVVDESALTGEVAPVVKREGSLLLAGTSNTAAKKSNKALTMRVTAIGSDLLVQSFTRRVQGLALERGKVDALTGKLTRGLFVLTIAAALVGSGLWLALDPSHFERAIYAGAAVLMAVNLAVVAGASNLVNTLTASVAGSRGVLIRARTALYRLRKSHIVVFNLVGTLTAGEPKLVDIHLAKGTSFGSKNEVLALAAAANANSDHVLARVISAEAVRRTAPEFSLHDIEPHPMGISARMDGSSVLVGGPGMLTTNNVPIDVQDLVNVTAANERGNSIVYVVVDHLLVGYLEFHDEIRETAREAVNQLQLQRKRVIAITGEATGVTDAVCKSLGITEFFAEVVKERKLDILDDLRRDGSIITVVGDAFEDAGILAAADVALALGVGNDLGIESADILVISTEPRAVSRVMKLAKFSTRAVNLNLVFATVFDIFALALAGFYPLPLLSSGLVLVSTVLAGNSIWRLRK